jgi:pimeloyl-ACP methyl ester carboxylesterase
MKPRDDQLGDRLPTMRSTTIDVHGPVHLAEWGEGPVRTVLVHGLGGSHLNWMRVAPALARYGRVLAPDLAGFGLSPVAGRRASVPAQRALLHRLIRQTCDQPVLLAGNSMGGMIALGEAALHPECVAGLMLVDAVLPGPWRQRRPRAVVISFASYLLSPLGRGLLRRVRDRASVDDLVKGALRLNVEHFERIPPDVIEAHVELERIRGRIPDNDGAYVEAARSIVLALARPGMLARIIDRVRVPTLIVQGAADRLVRLDAALDAHQERPDWDLQVLDDVGHIPMIEVPDRFLEIVDVWLRTAGLEPAENHLGRPAGI